MSKIMSEPTAKEIVDEIRRQGGYIWNDAGRLGWRLPTDLDPVAWRRLLAARKADLLVYLQPTSVLQDVIGTMAAAPEQASTVTCQILDLIGNEPARIIVVPRKDRTQPT